MAFMSASAGTSLLPAAMDLAMSSQTSLTSLTSLTSFEDECANDTNKRQRGGGLVERRKKTNHEARQKTSQGVLHSYKDGQAGTLRRKASTAPTSWPRDSSTGRSNRDSLEMSLDAWSGDATKKQLVERQPKRKRENHVHHYTVTVPHGITTATTSMLESPSDRRDGDGMPFVLPPPANAHVTPTKPAPQSFLSSIFSNTNNSTSSTSNHHPPRTPGPRTPTSASPARPSTVRRLARTLLEWNLGPQTDLSKWQRDSPRTPVNNHNTGHVNLMQTTPYRTPQTPHTPRKNRRGGREEEIQDELMSTPD